MLAPGLGTQAADGSERAEPPVDLIAHLAHAWRDPVPADRWRLGPELGHQRVDPPPLARQRLDQPAHLPDLRPGGLFGLLLTRHEPFQSLLPGAALLDDVLGGGRPLKRAPRVAAAKDGADRVLHASHVARRGEPRELAVRLAELAVQPQRLRGRQPGGVLRISERHQLTAVLPG